MNHSMTRAALALSVAIGCTTPNDSNESTYAEAVYRNYQDAANGKVHFELGVLDEGELAAIASRPLTDVLGEVPTDWIVFNARGPEILELARGPRNAAIDEWTTPPTLTDFETLGYPVAAGTYRLIEVRATIDGATTQHRALEACWKSLDHCVMIDPVVMQLDGYYKNRQRWLTEGWAPLIVHGDEPADALTLPEGVSAYTRYCKLSRYGTYSKRFYWPAQYAAGYNILGWKLYENWIGAQEVSIRCYVSGTSCKAAASAYSNGSSCSTFYPGWGCDCANVDHYGYTGSTAKTSAQTKCVDNFGGASVSVSLSGSGASFQVSWSLSSGSLYTNGGTYTDTCIWQ